MMNSYRQITILRYGNTNTFFVRGKKGSLLIDTDSAGTLPAFYKAIKQEGIRLSDITCVMATHYHPDHIGLIGDLMKNGVRLLLIDAQKEFVHFSDGIFGRDARLSYTPIHEAEATIISPSESRGFLQALGIEGEIISTPSHSPDSVSLMLDTGECIVGDLEPLEFLAAYEENRALQTDWEAVLSYQPKRILYAHVNEKSLGKTSKDKTKNENHLKKIEEGIGI